MTKRNFRVIASRSLAFSLALALTGCGGMPTNRQLESANQPVVEHSNYTYDISVGSDGGLDPVQTHRLSDWFAAMGLKYGDHVTLDDPAASGATHAAVEAVASRFGLMLDDTAPVTEGGLAAGTVRVVVSRSIASVPGCPKWSQAHSDANFNNATSPNFGCAVNGNLAAMVANKEDLVHGQTGVGDTVVLTNSKAIAAYREKMATGTRELKQTSSQQLQ